MMRDVSIKKILVPIDGSTYGETAVAYASMLAQSCGAYIELLSVVNVGDYVSGFEQAGADLFILKEMAQTAQDILEKHKNMIPDGIHVNTRVLQGNARDCILRVAKEEKADLIIIGRRGLGQLEGMILGSVSSYVVAHADCPVMTVK